MAKIIMSEIGSAACFIAVGHAVTTHRYVAAGLLLIMAIPVVFLRRTFDQMEWSKGYMVAHLCKLLEEQERKIRDED